MLANVGRIDRLVRIVAGLALVALAIAGPEIGWGWIGVLPLLSGITWHCPIYALFGISTCRRS